MSAEAFEGLEQAFVGSLLLRDDAVFETPPGFTAAALGHSTSRAVFEAVTRLAKSQRPVDLNLVAAEAKLSRDEVAWVRGAITVGTTNSVRPYAEKLLARHRRDSAIATLEQAAAELKKARAEEIAGVIGGVTAQLGNLELSDRPEWVDLGDVAQSAYARRQEIARGLPTGFAALDALVRIRPGNLVVLAAQSGMGKSTLALNIAENVARRFGRVLFHSLEMDDHEIWARIASRSAAVPVDALLSEANLAPEAEIQTQALATERPPLLLNCAHFSLGALLHITEKAHRKHGLKLAVVDYLGLVEVEGDSRVTEEAKLATVTRSFKLLAQRLRIPILLVAQLNREVDRRQDRKTEEESELPPPKLSDLRGSGRIGQDANTVLLLHNPFGASPDPDKRNRGPFQLRIEKQRMGKRGKVQLFGRLAFAEFTETESGKALLYARPND